MKKEHPPFLWVLLSGLIACLVALPFFFYSISIGILVLLFMIGLMGILFPRLLDRVRYLYWRKTLRHLGFEEHFEASLWHYDRSGCPFHLDLSRGKDALLGISAEFFQCLEIHLRSEEDEALGIELGDAEFDHRFVVEGPVDAVMAIFSRETRDQIRKIYKSPLGGFVSGRFFVPITSLTLSFLPTEIAPKVEAFLSFTKKIAAPFEGEPPLPKIAARALEDDAPAAVQAMSYLEDRYPNAKETLKAREELGKSSRGELRLAYAEEHLDQAPEILQALIDDQSLLARDRALALFALARIPRPEALVKARELLKTETPRLVEAALRVLTIDHAVKEGVLLDWIGNRFLWNDRTRLPECLRPYWIEEAKKAGRTATELCLKSLNQEISALARETLLNWDSH